MSKADPFERIAASAREANSNSFEPVSEAEIVAWESRVGLRLPSELKRFLMVVGHGFLTTDRHGQSQIDYPNNWMSLERLEQFWNRTEVSFQVDAELVDQGELAFFDMGSYAYLVVRPLGPKPNAVYRPYEKDPICGSITEFAERLFEDTTFYTEIPV